MLTVWTLVFVLNGQPVKQQENLGGEGCVMHLLSKTTPKGSYCISSDGKKRTNKPADCETVPGYPLYCRID